MSDLDITMRSRVLRLEEELNNMPQADCPVKHYFAPGMYAREITIPAGTVLTGAVHKTQNLAVLSKGRLQLVTDSGVIEISAPHTLTVSPGQKNAAFAIEESVWTNFFAIEETDTDKLVELLTESKASDLLCGESNAQLLQQTAIKKVEV